jgi:hypothetical protein
VLAVVTAVAVALCVEGQAPLQVAHEVGVLMAGETLRPQRESLVVWTSAVAWLVVVTIAVRLAWGIAVGIASWVRRVIAESQDGSRSGAFHVAIAFLLGLIVTTKPSGDIETAASVQENDTDDNRHVVIAARSQPAVPWGSASPLPALASMGLAVGLGAHVQRERATLLRDAPASARLRRPSAASLARGTALFECARAGQAIASSSVETEVLIVPLGVADDRLVQLTIRPGDAVSVDAEAGEALAVLRHIFNTVLTAPWLSGRPVVLCGFTATDVIVADKVVFAATPGEAVSTALAIRNDLSTGAPAVIVVADKYSPEFAELSDVGVAVITTGINPNNTATRLVRERHAWRVSTTDEMFRPYGVSPREADDFRTMLREMTVVEIEEPESFASVERTPLEGDWSVLVRVLGPVEVKQRDAGEVQFRKSKSVELLCWLALHRDRPTASAARTALWEIDVEDATFHNVLSELRRGLSSVGHDDAAGRVNKQRLFLADGVVTDAELLRTVLREAELRERQSRERRSQEHESQAPHEVIEKLLSVLQLVRGLPFADSGYAWADAEGITSTFVWLVTKAIDCVCDIAAQYGDEVAVFEATAAGLRMSPSDEVFLARRPVVAMARSLNVGVITATRTA